MSISDYRMTETGVVHVNDRSVTRRRYSVRLLWYRVC